MKTHTLALASLSAFLVVGKSPSTQAALLAYDSFDYAAGSLTGANGGTGFSGAYLASGAGSPVTTPGLTYTDSNLVSLPVAGNKAAFADGNLGEFRVLNLSPDAAGTTLYVSFIAQMSATAGYAGLSLFEGGVENLYLGKANNQTSFGIDTKSGSVVNSTISVSNPSLLVYKIDFLAGSANISLYVNPTLGTEPLTASATATKTAAFTWDRFRIQSGGGTTGSVDEVRFGTTYADVAPVPESSAALLGGLSLLGLLASRKRKIS